MPLYIKLPRKNPIINPIRNNPIFTTFMAKNPTVIPIIDDIIKAIQPQIIGVFADRNVLAIN